MITYYVGASADGFIATDDDNLDFLETVKPPPGEDYGYAAFYRSVDICVWGRTTYDWVMERAQFPYPDKENWILTRNRTGTGKHGEKFATFDADQWRHLAQDKHIWMVGGGEIASLFLAKGLIDKLILTVIPTQIGSGKKLFSRGYNASQWKLESSHDWPNGVTQNTCLFAPH